VKPELPTRKIDNEKISKENYSERMVEILEERSKRII